MYKVKQRKVGLNMEIKVYANYQAEVITEEEFLDKVRILAESYDCNMDAFAEFLNDNYDTLDIWNMKEDEKVKVKEHFHKENVKVATCDISCDWIETILEI